MRTVIAGSKDVISAACYDATEVAAARVPASNNFVRDYILKIKADDRDWPRSFVEYNYNGAVAAASKLVKDDELTMFVLVVKGGGYGGCDIVKRLKNKMGDKFILIGIALWPPADQEFGQLKRVCDEGGGLMIGAWDGTALGMC